MKTETYLVMIEESIRDMQSHVKTLREHLSAIREYTHDFDFVFTIVTDSKSREIHGDFLRQAIQARLDSMSSMELEEACGWVQTQEGNLT